MSAAPVTSYSSKRETVTPRTIVDPPETPEGRIRCRHDMLDGECSWCLGLNDLGDEE